MSNRIPHEPDCACQRCHERVSAITPATRVTHDGPTGSLDRSSVSTLEVLQDWQLRELRKTLDFAVGEDWNDD